VFGLLASKHRSQPTTALFTRKLSGPKDNDGLSPNRRSQENGPSAGTS
jgi:hypothetical protein